VIYRGTAIVVGNGLIGSFVSSQLDSAGYRVLALDRKNLLLLVKYGAYGNALGAFHEPFSVFVYAAGSTDISKAEQDGELDIVDHLTAFEAAFSFFERRRASTSYAFLISSGGTMYGHSHDPFFKGFSETDALMPISVYGKRNAVIEERFMSESSGLVYKCSLRVANPFHPLQYTSHRKGLLVSIIKAAIDRRTITLVANGRTVRNYFPLELLGRSILAMIEESRGETSQMPEVLNCGININLTALECVKILENYMSQKPKIAMDPFLPEYEVMNAPLDCSRLACLLRGQSNAQSLDLGIEFLGSHVQKLIRSCQQI